MKRSSTTIAEEAAVAVLRKTLPDRARLESVVDLAIAFAIVATGEKPDRDKVLAGVMFKITICAKVGA